MGDAESAVPPSKKRAAGREITKENPGLDDDDDAPEQESGTFKKASDEVLATRRIVKVRRQPSAEAAPSNPFAKISFVPPPTESAKPADVDPVSEKPGSGDVEGKNEGDNEAGKGSAVIEPNVEDTKSKEKTDEPEVESANNEKATNLDGTDVKEMAEGAETGEKAKKGNCQEDAVTPGSATPLSSFQQLSSNQNAFSGLAGGTGLANSTFSFGAGSPSFPTFNFNNSGNGSTSLFSVAGASNEASVTPSMQEVHVETGEENEKAVFAADAALFEYLEGGWKERGKGELKVNVSTAGVERARLVMRARGNYRLILNASLYSDMKLTNMEKRGITFACVNSNGEGKDGLSTFALKFKDGSVVEEFRMVVTAHKAKKTAALNTPENSPKASSDE